MADVLVVEDNPVIREMLEDWLFVNGYHVLTAAHGRAALDLLEAGASPRLILLDLRMPVMGGYEFLEQVSHTPFASIPVVVRLSLVDEREAYETLPARYGCALTDVGGGLLPVLEHVEAHCGAREGASRTSAARGAA